jgi:hypothetical protein
VIFESLEVSGRVLTQHISDLVFFVVRTPEVANVSGLALPHVVKSMVKSFLLGYKPLVHLKGTNLFLGCNYTSILSLADLVDLGKISLEIAL